MSSNGGAVDAEAGEGRPDVADGSSVGATDGRIPPAASSTAKRPVVQFALPRDVAGEGLSFAGGGGDQRVSVEGIVEYKDAPSRRMSRADAYLGRGGSLVGKRRQSSLESRRNVPESLLLNDRTSIAEDMEVADGGDPLQSKGDELSYGGRLRALFLNPSYSLRRQMLLTFGSVSFLTIFLVMFVSIISAITYKNSINRDVEELVYEFMGKTSRYMAEALSPKIMPNDLVDLMVEIAQDRFAGYPATKDDSLTPFFDAQSQTNIYPLKNQPLPFDWDFSHTPNEREGNVNDDNHVEHVQDRRPWYSSRSRLSTQVAMYMMQGACDPSAINSSAMEYYPNCSDANNNIITGGVLAPNPTNEQVYRKAADLSPFLKALFEYHQEIKSLGYYFSNSGAGSMVFFPHYELDSSGSYKSVGCDWMKTPNPLNATLGPIGTDEEIARCHPENETVPTREYNVLERAWCRDQALNPERVHITGPYTDAWEANNIWLISTGRAVYDRVTGAFVSCISVDFTFDGVEKVLEQGKVGDLGTVSLVRNDDLGTVITSPKFDFDNSDSTTTIDDPILETGITAEMFDEIKSIVDFSQPWKPEEVSKKYERVFDTENHIISVYPMPSLPDDYDQTYEPEFFTIFTLHKTEGLAETIHKISEENDDGVVRIVLLTVFVGLGGLAAIILVIFVTASWFTEPLKWMQGVGDQIVGKFGEELDSGIDYERKSLPCSPKTELSSLAEEFSKMVTRFSGEGTAKRVEVDDIEKVNLFDFSSEFSGLYRSREDSAFAFKYPKASNDSDAPQGQTPQQCNMGKNIRSSLKSAPESSALAATDKSGKVHKSPLFLWMVGLIVTPTLVTTAVISAVAVWQLSSNLPSLITPLKKEYSYLKDSYRFSVADMLAVSASAMSERAARDTYLLSRFASWLYFGGMEISGSFTDLIEGAEECKTAPSGLECEWAKDKPCDCAWNDFYVQGKADACTNYPRGESRILQKVFFEGQSQDVGPDGSRYSTSFPDVAALPNMTAWWDNITLLPKSTEESVSTKYGTTHDRAKIISALSTVFIPLYNYDKSNSKPVGLSVGFEADGMFAGYLGCDFHFVRFPFWRSTEENGAAKIRPELCPIGKYGYDSRCRGWYAEGKLKALAGNGNLHVTAPYIFADGGVLGQSITSPLMDPENGKHIGQVLVDFLPASIFKAIKNSKLSEGGFPIVITPEKDVLDHDTVVGPDFLLGGEGGEGKDIIELLRPDDAFELILRDMKAGERGNGIFSRDGPNGEKVHIAYAPVTVRNYYPRNSSDIASGVKNETTLVYSLALAETENGISEPFKSIDDDHSKTVKIIIGILSALIAISTILIVLIAFRVVASMAEPILKLLDVVKDINDMNAPNDTTTEKNNYKGSCREVDSVYLTMEMLYKVVQFANSAFFLGDLEVAYQVLRNALHLFIRLDNKKAIAVASNNLGSTMLSIYRTMKAGGSDKMCGLTKEEAIEKGTAYFTHSIKLGEEAYDEFYDKQGWSEECLVFMQFLANRYFNRALLFLTTSSDNKNRKEAESLGFRDLQIAADMDVEIVDQCLEMGFKINRVERYELMMSRVRGLLSLVELGYSPEELYVEDQIHEVYQDLKDAMKNSSHALFKHISIAGRMQKLDVELIKYFSQAKKENVNAARVAVRMLIEDEYIFHYAEQEAIRMLLTYMSTSNDKNCPADEDGSITQEMKTAVGILDHEHAERPGHISPAPSRRADIMKSLKSLRSLRSMRSLRTLSNNSILSDDSTTARKAERRVSTQSESSRGDATMEMF